MSETQTENTERTYSMRHCRHKAWTLEGHLRKYGFIDEANTVRSIRYWDSTPKGYSADMNKVAWQFIYEAANQKDICWAIMAGEDSPAVRLFKQASIMKQEWEASIHGR